MNNLQLVNLSWMYLEEGGIKSAGETLVFAVRSLALAQPGVLKPELINMNDLTNERRDEGASERRDGLTV